MKLFRILCIPFSEILAFVQQRRNMVFKYDALKLPGATIHQYKAIIICLTISAERKKPIRIWGQRHLLYFKECRRITYLDILTSGNLNSYLVDIDEQTEEILNIELIFM